jgi:hypothetical protein
MTPQADHPAAPGDDADLDELLIPALLAAPDDFTARVMAALPDRPMRPAPHDPPSLGWSLIRTLLVAAFGAAGTVEVLLFASSLWTATAVAMP